MDVEDPPDEDDASHRDRVNVGKMRAGLRSLALLDTDLYLGMQATNIAIVDGFISELEMSALRARMDEDTGYLPIAALVPRIIPE